MGNKKLSDLRNCDHCSGPVGIQFYVVRQSMALVTPGANQTLGLAQMFGGNLALAEVMSPSPRPVLVTGDEEPELMTESLICTDCFMCKPIVLATLIKDEDDDA